MSAETRHDEAMVRQALATLARSSQADGLSDRDADDMRRASYVATQAMDRVVTRLRAAEARTAWQPIETAPRDCCVIGWADEWARPDVAWYCAGAWWSGCGSPCPEITHWQPLPAAPEAP